MNSIPESNSPPPPPPPSLDVTIVLELEDQASNSSNHPAQLIPEPYSPPAPLNHPSPPNGSLPIHPSHPPHPEWFSLFMNFCFTGVSISFQSNSNQAHHHHSISFQMAALGMVFALAAFVLSKYIPGKLIAQAGVLENVGVFCGVTSFLINLTPFFHLCLKIISWTVYVISLLAIIISSNINISKE